MPYWAYSVLCIIVTISELENIFVLYMAAHTMNNQIRTLFYFCYRKMMILSYQDKSIRVVVTTGNLIEFDWENTTQG